MLDCRGQYWQEPNGKLTVHGGVTLVVCHCLPLAIQYPIALVVDEASQLVHKLYSNIWESCTYNESILYNYQKLLNVHTYIPGIDSRSGDSHLCQVKLNNWELVCDTL